MLGASQELLGKALFSTPLVFAVSGPGALS